MFMKERRVLTVRLGRGQQADVVEAFESRLHPSNQLTRTLVLRTPSNEEWRFASLYDFGNWPETKTMILRGTAVFEMGSEIDDIEVRFDLGHDQVGQITVRSSTRRNIT